MRREKMIKMYDIQLVLTLKLKTNVKIKID